MRGAARASSTSLLLLSSLLLPGCATAPRGPKETLQTFARALERNESGAAYRLMSDGYRRRVSLEEFTRRVAGARLEGASELQRLRQNAPAWAGRIEVALGAEGARVPLVHEAGGWRLDEPPFETDSQRSPHAALAAFLRATESGRYDLLLQLAPERHRSGLSAAKLRAFWEGPGSERTRALLPALRLALDRRAIEDGNEAFLPYGGGRQVHFVREEGVWRVEAVE